MCALGIDPQLSGEDNPFSPEGTVDGKVVDSRMAKQMSFVARWGAACGTGFDAKKFLMNTRSMIG